MDLNRSITLLSNSTLLNPRIEKSVQPPQWIVVIFFILLACGCLVNVANVLALIRTRRNGTLTLVLQIAFVDILSIYIAIIEITALTRATWPFSTEQCPLFTGSEIFVNTLTIYLLVCFNFHLISLWNMHHIESTSRTNKNPLTKSDSNECFITKQENRQITIDYRKRRSQISTIFPATFVWFVSLSLSIPNFTLSTTAKLKGDQVICAIIDFVYVQAMQYSLLTFKIVIPVLLLTVSFIIIVIKLTRSTDSNVDNFLAVKANETRKYLIFAIALSTLYFVTSLQRLISHFVHIVSYSFDEHSVHNFRMPPLYNNYLRTSVPYIAMIHYLGAPLRATLYLVLLPKFRYLLRNKLFVCCGRK